MSEKSLSSWNQILLFPESASITAFAEYNGKLIAVGWKYNDVTQTDCCVIIYYSEDNGDTWREIQNIPSELSVASAVIITNGRIFISGRKGQCKQKWTGAVYTCNINEILNH